MPSSAFRWRKGYDARDYALNCFGGAGGQHACLVADALGMTTIFIHPFSGLLSAYGMKRAACAGVAADGGGPAAFRCGNDGACPTRQCAGRGCGSRYRGARRACAAIDYPRASALCRQRHDDCRLRFRISRTWRAICAETRAAFRLWFRRPRIDRGIRWRSKPISARNPAKPEKPAAHDQRRRNARLPMSTLAVLFARRVARRAGSPLGRSFARACCGRPCPADRAASDHRGGAGLARRNDRRRAHVLLKRVAARTAAQAKRQMSIPFCWKCSPISSWRLPKRWAPRCRTPQPA